MRWILPFVLVAGCNAYSTTKAPDDPVPRPYACTREFAATFTEPFLVTAGPAYYQAFSSDCRCLLTIDQGVKRLRVTDLEARTTVELEENVYLAHFTTDGSQVLFFLQGETGLDLFLARGTDVHLLDRDVSTALVQSSDGSRLAYTRNQSMENYTSELHLAELDVWPPVTRPVADAVLGTPTFTPDGSQLVYIDDPVEHSHESPDGSCIWTTANLKAFSEASAMPRIIARDVVAWAYRLSIDGRRVFATTKFQCEDQSQTLLSCPLSGGEPTVLLRGVSTYSGPHDLLEVPDREILVHFMISFGQDPADYLSELWATRTDGSGSNVLAHDVMSYMQTCRYFFPVQMARDDKLVYVERETHAVRAVDVGTADSWTVVEGAHDLLVLLSPDGREVLNQVSEGYGEPADLVITPVTGGESRVLMERLTQGTRFEWSPSGERIVMLDWWPTNGTRNLVSVLPDTGEIRIVADDVPGEWGSNYDYALHPGGWLAVVQKAGGLHVVAIP